MISEIFNISLWAITVLGGWKAYKKVLSQQNRVIEEFGEFVKAMSIANIVFDTAIADGEIDNDELRKIAKARQKVMEELKDLPCAAIEYALAWEKFGDEVAKLIKKIKKIKK